MGVNSQWHARRSSADRAVWLGGWWLAEAVEEHCSVVGCSVVRVGGGGGVAEEMEAGLTNKTEASLSMRLCMDTEVEAEAEAEG